MLNRPLARLLALTFLAVSLLPATAADQSLDREALKDAFDQVARNFGAFENAFYTYTLEFGELPDSPTDLVRTGHLSMVLTNPYTGEPVAYPSMESISAGIRSDEARGGDIWYRPDHGEGVGSMAALFLNPNDPTEVKWMRRDIVKYVNEADRRVVFDPDDSREVQLSRVMAEQLLMAIEDYQIRYGTVPEHLSDLEVGDTLADFPNAFNPNRLVKESATLSPGDLWYRRLTDDWYDLVVWGPRGPVYFVSEDPTHWGVQYDPFTRTAEVRLRDPNDPVSALTRPYELPNRFILVYREQEAIDREREVAWTANHPDCLDCGSTYVFWDIIEEGLIACRDIETGEYVDDCCCAELGTE